MIASFASRNAAKFGTCSTVSIAYEMVQRLLRQPLFERLKSLKELPTHKHSIADVVLALCIVTCNCRIRDTASHERGIQMANQKPQMSEDLQHIVLDRRWWIWDPPPDWFRIRLERDENLAHRFLAMEIEFKQQELKILQEKVQLEQDKLQKFGELLG